MSTPKADKISFDDRLSDRLARVEGQVRALRKMIEEERACEDVLNQLLAARSGLEKAGLMVLDRHLADCVLEDANLPDATMERLRGALRLWGRHATE